MIEALNGFAPGNILTDIISGVILLVVGYCAHRVARAANTVQGLSEGFKELREEFHQEKNKRKRFQKRIVKRMDRYENNAVRRDSV